MKRRDGHALNVLPLEVDARGICRDFPGASPVELDYVEYKVSNVIGFSGTSETILLAGNPVYYDGNTRVLLEANYGIAGDGGSDPHVYFKAVNNPSWMPPTASINYRRWQWRSLRAIVTPPRGIERINLVGIVATFGFAFFYGGMDGLQATASFRISAI